MEDVELMRRIRKAGHKILFIPDRVRTSARRWEKEGILFCTLRNWSLVILYTFGVDPCLLARFYQDHDGEERPSMASLFRLWFRAFRGESGE